MNMNLINNSNNEKRKKTRGRTVNVLTVQIQRSSLNPFRLYYIMNFRLRRVCIVYIVYYANKNHQTMCWKKYFLWFYLFSFSFQLESINRLSIYKCKYRKKNQQQQQRRNGICFCKLFLWYFITLSWFVYWINSTYITFTFTIVCIEEKKNIAIACIEIHVCFNLFCTDCLRTQIYGRSLNCNSFLFLSWYMVSILFTHSRSFPFCRSCLVTGQRKRVCTYKHRGIHACWIFNSIVNKCLPGVCMNFIWYGCV